VLDEGRAIPHDEVKRRLLDAPVGSRSNGRRR
jgi:hypothetical protein